MALIRLQDKVPNVYVDKSRDFQLLCRAYDLANNQVKFDIDSMPFILSSSQCRDNILPLLQTKLGFETSALIDGDSLRIILTGFPDIIKYKGSLTGVQRAINAWLKTIHLETSIRIDVFNVLGGPYNFVENEGQTIGGLIGQTKIPAYTIAIGVQGNPRDYSVLKEILKYVIPTGYNLYFYFFEEFGVDETTPTIDLINDFAVLVTVSDDVNSVVRNSSHDNETIDGTTINIVEQGTVNKVITTPFSTEMAGSTDVAENQLEIEAVSNTDEIAYPTVLGFSPEVVKSSTTKTIFTTLSFRIDSSVGYTVKLQTATGNSSNFLDTSEELITIPISILGIPKTISYNMHVSSATATSKWFRIKIAYKDGNGDTQYVYSDAAEFKFISGGAGGGTPYDPQPGGNSGI